MNICFIRFCAKKLKRNHVPCFMLDYFSWCVKQMGHNSEIYDMWIENKKLNFVNFDYFIIECSSYDYKPLMNFVKKIPTGKKILSCGNFKIKNSIFSDHIKPFDEIKLAEIFNKNFLNFNFFEKWPTDYSKNNDYIFLYPVKEIKKIKWFFNITGIGCFGKCRYCSGNIRKSSLSPVRNRNINQILNEILKIPENKRYIVFEDDNFFRDKKFTFNLLNEIIRRKIKIKWSAQARADSISDIKTVKLIKKSGCILMRIGAESYSKKTLTIAGKGKKYTNHLDKSASLLNKFNIPFVLLTIIGLPYDTKKALFKTLKFCINSNAHIIQLHNFVPYEDSFFGKKFGVDNFSYHYNFRNKNYSYYGNFFKIIMFFIFYFCFFIKKIVTRDFYHYIKFYLKNTDYLKVFFT